jgi:hypothetical protein
MGFYSFGLCLLLLSHAVLAQTERYWSDFPAAGALQLSDLSAEQQLMLSEHLNLSSAQTELWLDQLPQLLNELSCQSLDLQSQPLPAYLDESYKLVSYGGVLKWASEDKTKDTVWWLPWSLLPLLPQLKDRLTDPSLQLHQPLLLDELQLANKGQFLVISGSAEIKPSYYALQLNNIEQPKLLWSIDAAVTGFDDLSGSMAQPLVWQSQKGLSLLLPNTGVDPRNTLIYKVSLQTAAIEARLSREQNQSALSGALTLYDHNMDSVADHLVFSSKSGQLWQVVVEDHQFYGIQTVADLSDLRISDVQFIDLIYAAVPVAGSGSDFHSRRSQWLILLSALQQKQSVFVLLKPQDGLVLTRPDLVDRTLPKPPQLPAFTDLDWQQVQQKNGWYSQLDGRLSHSPVVAAGVIYLPLLAQEPQQACSIESVPASLMALHIHHGASVYRQGVFSVPQPLGKLVVKANTAGGFALVERHNQQILIEELEEISADCSLCSKPLQQGSFPRWQLMGTYHNEEGAYE